MNSSLRHRLVATGIATAIVACGAAVPIALSATPTGTRTDTAVSTTARQALRQGEKQYRAKLDATKLPLGDGKITTSGARRDHIYLCQRGRGGGPGAGVTGWWIDEENGTYNLEAKAVVDGAVEWPQANVRIRKSGSRRVITGNNLPVDSTTGEFPVRGDDDAAQVDPNPNAISPQRVRLSLTANPKAAAKPSCLSMGPIGITVDGVAIFNGLDAQNQDAVAHEVQDACGGHPEMRGAYHYHAISDCVEDPNGNENLVGYALDGFPIYASTENGRQITNDDLDACHGHRGTVELDGRRQRIYHYHATLEYPYTLGCFKGTPARLAR
jgi:hypothetical protein